MTFANSKKHRTILQDTRKKHKNHRIPNDIRKVRHTHEACACARTRTRALGSVTATIATTTATTALLLLLPKPFGSS